MSPHVKIGSGALLLLLFVLGVLHMLFIILKSIKEAWEMGLSIRAIWGLEMFSPDALLFAIATAVAGVIYISDWWWPKLRRRLGMDSDHRELDASPKDGGAIDPIAFGLKLTSVVGLKPGHAERMAWDLNVKSSSLAPIQYENIAISAALDGGKPEKMPSGNGEIIRSGQTLNYSFDLPIGYGLEGRLQVWANLKYGHPGSAPTRFYSREMDVSFQRNAFSNCRGKEVDVAIEEIAKIEPQRRQEAQQAPTVRQGA